MPFMSSSSSSWTMVVVGTVIGAVTTLWILQTTKKETNHKTKRRSCIEDDGDDIDFDPPSLTKITCGSSSTTTSSTSINQCPFLRARRERLPSLIVLLRHGESEGNADHTLWRNKPDNLINLTPKGIEESKEAGKRIETLFQAFDDVSYDTDDDKKDTSSITPGQSVLPPIRRVHIHVSPFERTLQTARAARPYFEHRVVRTCPEPRIREQEFGNVSEKDSHLARREQELVGRFWYRFTTGESGADVYDRVKSWWCESILSINERVGYEHVDAIVVVTHGLTLRFVLMQLYNWSPHTFHSVWNANNCDMYVLRKDLTKPGISPYVLDDVYGDMPQSSVNLLVITKEEEAKQQQKHDEDDGDNPSLTQSDRMKSSSFNDGTEGVGMSQKHKQKKKKKKGREYRLDDYLSIPPPRTIQVEVIQQKLVSQYPNDFPNGTDDIESISFLPFTDGASIKECHSELPQPQQGHDDVDGNNNHNTTNNKNGHGPQQKQYNNNIHHSISGSWKADDDEDDDDDDEDPSELQTPYLAEKIAVITKHAKPEVSFRWPSSDDH